VRGYVSRSMTSCWRDDRGEAPTGHQPSPIGSAASNSPRASPSLNSSAWTTCSMAARRWSAASGRPIQLAAGTARARNSTATRPGDRDDFRQCPRVNRMHKIFTSGSAGLQPYRDKPALRSRRSGQPTSPGPTRSWARSIHLFCSPIRRRQPVKFPYMDADALPDSDHDIAEIFAARGDHDSTRPQHGVDNTASQQSAWGACDSCQATARCGISVRHGDVLPGALVGNYLSRQHPLVRIGLQ